MHTQSTTATYTRLRSGEWGVRIVGGDVTVGDRIAVSKRDGSRKTERIAKVIWTGEGVTLASVDSDRDYSARRSTARTTYDPDKFNGYGRARGGHRKACVTDGNCSSFGAGRSCGGWDCDGY